MIKNDRERQKVEEQIRETKKLLESNRAVLKQAGIPESEIDKYVEANEAILRRFEKDLHEYIELKTGKMPETGSLETIGELLVKFRIGQGMSQKELADKIKVDETQLSRYERTGYRGAGLERIKAVLEALGVKLTLSFEKVGA